LAVHGDEGSLRRNKASQLGNEHSTHGDVGDSAPDGLTRVCDGAGNGYVPAFKFASFLAHPSLYYQLSRMRPRLTLKVQHSLE
jgi:hypothetical protein